jgi:asparagine synthase (glutamine-hydrolysing)
MCGIIGVAGPASQKEGLLQRSIEALSHRGPEDRGVLPFAQAVLGHTRLSFIDLSPAGHQPMRDTTQNIAITFNGEIYNYKQLRTQLEKKGHVFTTHSDTEVILKCYLEYGEQCPEHLEGQFAFAIWDNRDQSLFLARDRFGEKPLYVAKMQNGIVFGSEIKALLATGLVKEEIDHTSLDNYLTLLYVPPWRSLYKDIQPLPPAHRALWKNGAYKEERYWQLIKEANTDSLETAAAKVRELLTEAVRASMVADVEVGAFLSGGIDSSLVVRLAQQESPRPLKTFSAGFEGFINELPYAQEIATLAKTDHHPAEMKDDLLETFLAVSRYFDEPFGDSSNIPTSLISKLARREVKVALSGDGGDELFYGYGQYTRYNHLPKMQTLINALSGSDAYSYFKTHLLSQFSEAERRALLKNTSAIEADPTTHLDLSQAETPLEKINLVDFYMGLPGDMLTKVDRASMMHSLEIRSPFLNHTLAQYAYNLPAQYKTDGRRGKIILEKAFEDLLPQGFFTRKKQGFGAPLKNWLVKPAFKKLVDEWFTRDARVGAFLNLETVQKYLARFYAGDTSLQYKVWSLLALEAWLRSRETV